jgi:carbohydrate-binding DOMON domain-containing protein
MPPNRAATARARKRCGHLSSADLHVAAADPVAVPAGVAPSAVESLLVNGITAWQMLRSPAPHCGTTRYPSSQEAVSVPPATGVTAYPDYGAAHS